MSAMRLLHGSIAEVDIVQSQQLPHVYCNSETKDQDIQSTSGLLQRKE